MFLEIDTFIGDQCVTPCDGHPCQNGGVCEDLDDGDFECICEDDFKGEFCEIGLSCNYISTFFIIHHTLYLT